MRVMILKDEAAVAKAAYEVMRTAMVDKQYKVLGFATGSSPLGLYAELVKGYQRGELDFSDISTFNLDEYVGLPADHEQSYRYFMEKNLFGKVNVKPGNVHFLNGMTDCIEEDCAAYEAAMEELGGLKLQLLGLGRDGHIGFNEPGTPFFARTSYVTLTKETIEDNKRFFASIDDVPRWALSMGIGTIMDAKELLMIATGANKADAVAAMIEGPISALCPASALQCHPETTVVLDEAAASKLQHADFWTKNGNDYEEMLAFLHAARCKAGLEDA